MKVLIIRVGALGDVLHALPAVAALRSARPDWEIDWVVDPRWAPLLAAMDTDGRGPHIRRVHIAETKQWSAKPLSWATARSILKLRSAVNSERYDIAVDMQGTLRSSVIGGFAKARVFAGYSDPRESLARSLYGQPFTRRGTHIVEQGMALLAEASGVELISSSVQLPYEGWAEDWARELVDGRKICMLGAGGGWGAKQWPAQRYGELAQDLKAMGYTVLVNAPRKDDAVVASVIQTSNGAAEPVVCNVAGLVALTRRAALMVGGDTGPMHLAATFGIPVVALFGPTSPERNGPWGPGPKIVLRDPNSLTTYKRTQVTEAGLAKISVWQVMEAVRTLGNW